MDVRNLSKSIVVAGMFALSVMSAANAQNAEATAQRLVERLHKRQGELDGERQITALPPVLKGAALIIPKGLPRATRVARPVSISIITIKLFSGIVI